MWWRWRETNLVYQALLELQWIQDQLAIELGASLSQLHGKVDTLMASEQDLQNDLDAIKAGLVLVATKQTAQAQQIADLQAQVAAGTPVSQAQLDALKSEADDIVAALSPLTA